MSLRDEVADIIRQMRPATERADLILAIPEIAEALEISAGVAEGDFRDYLLKRGRWAERTDEMGYV